MNNECHDMKLVSYTGNYTHTYNIQPTLLQSACRVTQVFKCLLSWCHFFNDINGISNVALMSVLNKNLWIGLNHFIMHDIYLYKYHRPVDT